MPSFTLDPFECERSRIRRHLLVSISASWVATAPRLLTLTYGYSLGLNKPFSWPFVTSFSRAFEITNGCSFAEGWLELHGVHC